MGLVTTCACRIVGAANVVAYEGDPRLALQARETTTRNGFPVEVVNAVLGATDGEASFYVHRDFWVSGLLRTENAQEIRVPVRSFGGALDSFRPTYLMVDIEGGEVDLLAFPLPAYVRAVCVETHPAVVGVDAIRALLLRLMTDGFYVDLHESRDDVAFLVRPVTAVI
jgi:FkbM family methyltransferase